MTEKEKAKELIQKYIDIMPMLRTQTGRAIMDHAKECALITVDEIKKIGWNLPHYDNVTGLEYWQNVKSEIELL
jgi:hypothetical protein